MKTSTRRGGFTLMELMFALGILVVSMIGLVSVISYTTRENEINRENLLAMRAAEGKVEEMKQFNVNEIFARYSCTNWATQASLLYPTGTTPLTGLFPGPDFTAAIAGDLSYARLRNVKAGITFTLNPQTGQSPQNGVHLMENWTTDPDPIAQDLNANGLQDDASTSYVVLPATITISWTGIKGARNLSYRYLFFVRP